MTQDQALDIMKLGRNVFLTGAAGSGKSYLVQKYVTYLKKNKITVSVTASTGIAATQIDGRTIHSWAGIGIHDDMTDREITRLFYNNDVRKRVTQTQVLVIDEISMLGAPILDLLDRVCKSLRQDKKPFGGMQMIVCGDFFQLPPIPHRESGKPTGFAFTAEAWKQAEFATCYLETQHRQTDDQYLELLSDIRKSNITESVLSTLFSRHGKSVDRVMKPTRLYTHNIDVDALNAEELDALPAESKRYEMKTIGDEKLVQNLKKYCLVPEMLELKKDAVVMFVQNNRTKGYVNGTLGIVTGFDEISTYPIVETASGREVLAKPGSWKIEEEDEVVAEIIQVPIRLAWAITVHKSQGMSLDAAEIDLSKAFAEGMGYVALSRVRTLEGIALKGLNEMALKVNRKITELDGELQSQSEENANELKKMGARVMKQKMKKFILQHKAQQEKDGKMSY